MIHGPAERGFSYIIGAKGLKDDLELYTDRPKYQRLVIDFEKGEDPDDAYSRIPYEKGSNLILHLGTCITRHRLSVCGLTDIDRANGRRSGCLPAVRV